MLGSSSRSRVVRRRRETRRPPSLKQQVEVGLASVAQVVLVPCLLVVEVGLAWLAQAVLQLHPSLEQQVEVAAPGKRLRQTIST